MNSNTTTTVISMNGVAVTSSNGNKRVMNIREALNTPLSKNHGHIKIYFFTPENKQVRKADGYPEYMSFPFARMSSTPWKPVDAEAHKDGIDSIPVEVWLCNKIKDENNQPVLDDEGNEQFAWTQQFEDQKVWAGDTFITKKHQPKMMYYLKKGNAFDCMGTLVLLDGTQIDLAVAADVSK